MKKIIKIFLLFILAISYFWNSYVFAESIIDNNIIKKAYDERREKMLELIWWWKLETEITSLKTELSKLEIWTQLDESTRTKILNEIDLLEEELRNLNLELVSNINDTSEIDELVEKYNYEVDIKKDLVNQLNTSIKENEISLEKINLLIEDYAQEKTKIDNAEKKARLTKIIIFFITTIILLLIYFLFTYLSKNGKLGKKRYIYINFFLVFTYIIFLIWYFFYLYPQFSIFLIFMSWYLLVINAHLIGSFVWSIIVLQRFKIWDVVKFGNIYWKISNISPLYIILAPIDNWIITYEKLIYIPHINVLKNSTLRDSTPELQIHNFNLTIWVDSWIDVMIFLEEVEKTVLQKFLTNKLKTIPRDEKIYNINFDFTPAANFIIKFTWLWEISLNSKVERKIVWVLTRYLLEAKRLKELKKAEQKIIEQPKQEEIKEENGGEESSVMV